MSQSNSRLFDDLGRLMTDAAGFADGVKREVETVAKAQIERAMASMDIPGQDDIETLRELIAVLREENRSLSDRISVLEAGGNPPENEGSSADAG